MQIVRRIFLFVVAISLSGLALSAAPGVVQLTEPKFSPADGVEFGLHRLPASSPHSDLVAFSSHSAALVDNDTNNLPDIFLWSRSTGQVRLLTVGTNGGANGASFDPALSADGQFVAFVSTASNFLPDTNKIDDVYIANVATGEIELVSVRQQLAGAKISATRNTVINEDGRYVAFTAARADLLPSGTSTREHVLIRDRQAGETIWANSTLEGTSSFVGRPVALHGSNLWFFWGTNFYQFDIPSRTATRIEVSSVEPAFSSDFSKVALQKVSSRTNAVMVADIVSSSVKILFTDVTNRVSRYDAISISDNGLVAFMAADATDTNRTADVYVVDSTVDPPPPPTLVSSIPTPSDSTVMASSPMISPDGKRVYFKFTTISTLNGARQADLYVRDLAASTPELVASGSYFSKLIRTPTGPLVLGGSGAFSFATGSDETDLALLPYPAAALEIPLRIARNGSDWRISFEKIPNTTPKVQTTDSLSPPIWTDLSITPEDGGTEWIVLDPANLNQRFYRLQVSP
jgi:Tol biopolymer transport system component